MPSIKVEARSTKTKSGLNQLRSQGKIPGIVYGKDIDSISISIDEKELNAFLRSTPNAIAGMEVPEFGSRSVLISDIQRDPLRRNIVHIDFRQINTSEPVRTTVSLEFIGEPAGVKLGGVLQTQLHEIEIFCLPNLIPSSIQVDISGIELGNNLLVNDLTIPEGIELVTEADDVVMNVLHPQKAAEEEAEVVEAGTEATEDKGN